LAPTAGGFGMGVAARAVAARKPRRINRVNNWRNVFIELCWVLVQEAIVGPWGVFFNVGKAGSTP
jgi:hypothetical protein